MASKRTLLLTGATGFLGSQVLEKIPPTFHVLLLKSRTTGSTYRGFPAMTIEQLADEHLDVIVHVAASIHGSAQEQETSNVRLTETLVALAATHKSSFIFISSLNVKLDHQGIYESSKMRAEKIIVSKLENCCVIRPSYLFGVDDDPNLAPLLRIAWLLRLLRYIPFPPFKTKIQPLDVEELADFIVSKALSSPFQEKLIVEAGGPQQQEVVTVMEEFLEARGIRCHFFYLPSIVKVFFRLPWLHDRCKVFFQDKVTEDQDAFIGKKSHNNLSSSMR